MRLRRCAFDDPVETTGSMKASSWMKAVVWLRIRRMNAVRIHWAENRVVNLVVRDPNGGWKSVLSASQLLGGQRGGEEGDDGEAEGGHQGGVVHVPDVVEADRIA
jgi:hypothetical protein